MIASGNRQAVALNDLLELAILLALKQNIKHTCC